MIYLSFSLESCPLSFLHARTVSFSQHPHLWIVPLSFACFQAQKTATRLWSENVVLDTSKTFGVTHESRFFDWGEPLTFMLPDMDRIVRHFCPLSSSRTSFPLAILLDFLVSCLLVCVRLSTHEVSVPVPILLRVFLSTPLRVLPLPFALSSLLSLGCTLIPIAMYSISG